MGSGSLHLIETDTYTHTHTRTYVHTGTLRSTPTPPSVPPQFVDPRVSSFRCSGPRGPKHPSYSTDSFLLLWPPTHSTHLLTFSSPHYSPFPSHHRPLIIRHSKRWRKRRIRLGKREREGQEETIDVVSRLTQRLRTVSLIFFGLLLWPTPTFLTVTLWGLLFPACRFGLLLPLTFPSRVPTSLVSKSTRSIQ